MSRVLIIVVIAVVLIGGYLLYPRLVGHEPAKAVPEPGSLVVTDITPGTGATAIAGSHVRVHYTGWLYDPQAPQSHGRKFDSSVDRNEPFEFLLGAHQVIAGWDQGVAGMQVGGKRTLVIPSGLAYGSRGAGSDIPPNATLVFDVELLGVE